MKKELKIITEPDSPQTRLDPYGGCTNFRLYVDGKRTNELLIFNEELKIPGVRFKCIRALLK